MSCCICCKELKYLKTYLLLGWVHTHIARGLGFLSWWLLLLLLGGGLLFCGSCSFLLGRGILGSLLSGRLFLSWLLFNSGLFFLLLNWWLLLFVVGHLSLV